MKRLLLGVFFAVNLFAAADCNLFFGAGGGTPFAGAGNSVQLSNKSKNCYDWRVSYQSQGFSAVSLIIEIAPDVNGVPGSWITFLVPEVTNPIQGVNPSTDTAQASAYFRGAPAWIRARLASATGSGTVSGVLYGCQEPGCGSGMALAASSSGSGCPNPCPVTQSGTWNVGITGNPAVVGPDATGAVPTKNPLYTAGFDGTNVQPMKVDTSGRQVNVGAAVDGAAVAGAPLLTAGADGTNVRIFRTTSATNNTNLTQQGVALHEKGARWSVLANGSFSAQGTATRAAGGAGVRHVVDCISFSAVSGSAPALTNVNLNIRDGATGAGSVIWSISLEVSATTGQNVAPHSICGLSLVGSVNTAMTVEFSAAVTNVAQAVNMSGYDVN